MNSPQQQFAIHLQPKTALRKALDGILQIECSGCHILIDVDCRNNEYMPACTNCGPVIWYYSIPAIMLLRANGHLQ